MSTELPVFTDPPNVDDRVDGDVEASLNIPLQPQEAQAPIGDSPLGGPSSDDVRRRWDLVLPHRNDLLRIAARRLGCAEDAEDVVATAMLRTVESRTLDETRVGQFLCTTVMRLTVDVHRDRVRQLAIGARHAARELSPASAEDTVCDEAEARWLKAALSDAPVRERQVLEARLTGLVGSDVATHLGLSPKAAENAYTRLRERARSLVAATLSGIAVVGGYIRRAGPSSLAAPVVLASAVLTLGQLPPDESSPQMALAPPAEHLEFWPTDGRTRTGARANAATNNGRADGPAASIAVAASGPTRPRVLTVAPPEPARKVVQGGAVHVEEQPEYEDETFLESVQRCIANVDPQRALADPCA